MICQEFVTPFAITKATTTKIDKWDFMKKLKFCASNDARKRKKKNKKATHRMEKWRTEKQWNVI